MRVRLALPMAGLLVGLGSFIVLGSMGCQGKNPNPFAGKKPPLTKLGIEDLEVGDGPVAEEHDFVTVLYTGTFGDDTVFDSTEKNNNTPYAFAIGDSAVIKGWHEGVKGMKVGGIRHLSIPWKDGYGENGSDTIPPKADLYFTIKLLDVIKKGNEEVYELSDLKEGTGPAAKMGDTVTIAYTASLMNDKVVDKQDNITFKLGIAGEESIRGLAEGITGMKVGGKRYLKIPPPLAFGEENKGPIPGDAVLKVTVDLKAIK